MARSGGPRAAFAKMRTGYAAIVSVSVRFAISIPQYARDSRFDDQAFRRHLRSIEESGAFESGWVQEQVIGAAGSLAPLQALTYAAACTERLRLGCAVFVLPLHNPLHLAKAVSSLDCLSQGRVEVGLATGGAQRPFAAFGIDPDKPVGRFNEALALMKACWTEEQIEFDGRWWQLHGASMEPKPVQKPHPPVWFGGSAPAGMRRAARHADGFMGAGSQTTARFAEQVAIVTDELAAQNRDPASFRFGKRVYVHVEDDRALAQRRLEDALRRHYGGGEWSEHIVTGPAEECAAGIRAVADAGAELILLNPLVDDEQQLERLGNEVIPALT
jgi:probable F420-dependent oxidoreductase